MKTRVEIIGSGDIATDLMIGSFRLSGALGAAARVGIFALDLIARRERSWRAASLDESPARR